MSEEKPMSEQSFGGKALAAAIFALACCLAPLALGALGVGAWIGLR